MTATVIERSGPFALIQFDEGGIRLWVKADNDSNYVIKIGDRVKLVLELTE